MIFPLMLLLAAITIPDASPSPAQVGVPSPLREIGRVQALSVCSAIVVHANSAIGVALDNNEDLAIAINRLRTTDLDSPSEIARRNGFNDLGILTGRIRSAAATGVAEIKRLRAMAAQTTEPTRKVELRAFADALSGAIVRQRKAATDLDTMLAVIDGRRAMEEVDTPELVDQRASLVDARIGIAGGDAGVLRNPAAPVAPTRVDPLLRAMADDLGTRTQDILRDEGAAADHSLGATTGC